MKRTAANAISIANGEKGYLEKKSNKNLDSKTANAGKNNYTKYNAVFGVNGCFWCCYFVMWVFYMLCGKNKTEAKKLVFVITGACETSRQAFIKNGRFYTKNPKPGDLVYFKGTRHAGANHIAIVTKVTNGKIYTVEGNTSTGKDVVDNGGGVAEKSYSLSYNKILGYGRPKYESEKDTVKVVQTTTTVKEATTVKVVSYYKRYTGKSNILNDILTDIGVPSKYRGALSNRKALAKANGISDYKGTESQNLKLIKLAKEGKLKKV